MRILDFIQVKLAVKEKVLKYREVTLASDTSFPKFSFFRDSHTQIVRHANMSKNRIIPVALPVQSHGTGDDLKL